jgi:DNA-binding NarL/FixJ family response regulator
VDLMRVLIVDDHTIVRDALATALADEADIEIVGKAATGRVAVEQVRTLRPEVVLMDIRMPEMDGIEATRVICAEFPATCVIGLSMFERQEQAQAMYEAGAMEYLTKEVRIDALIAVMRGCYEQRRHDRPKRPYH